VKGATQLHQRIKRQGKGDTVKNTRKNDCAAAVAEKGLTGDVREQPQSHKTPMIRSRDHDSDIDRSLRVSAKEKEQAK
jgi:hypothetical protein